MLAYNLILSQTSYVVSNDTRLYLANFILSNHNITNNLVVNPINVNINSEVDDLAVITTVSAITDGNDEIDNNNNNSHMDIIMNNTEISVEEIIAEEPDIMDHVITSSILSLPPNIIGDDVYFATINEGMQAVVYYMANNGYKPTIRTETNAYYIYCSCNCFNVRKNDTKKNRKSNTNCTWQCMIKPLEDHGYKIYQLSNIHNHIPSESNVNITNFIILNDKDIFRMIANGIQSKKKPKQIYHEIKNYLISCDGVIRHPYLDPITLSNFIQNNKREILKEVQRNENTKNRRKKVVK